MTFRLHPNLAATSAPVCDLGVSQARLQLDARFPWIVLIPMGGDYRELDELSPDGRATLMAEIALASEAVRVLGRAAGRPVEKINVGALGNVTPQLHVHVLGRRSDDGVWPDPVWGRGAPAPYTDDALADAVRTAAAVLTRGS